MWWWHVAQAGAIGAAACAARAGRKSRGPGKELLAVADASAFEACDGLYEALGLGVLGLASLLWMCTLQRVGQAVRCIEDTRLVVAATFLPMVPEPPGVRRRGRKT